MFIALDLETTWLDWVNDEIIEVALVLVDSKTFEIKDKFSTLINPWIEITPVISNITSIFNEDILDAPYIDEVQNKIIDFIWDYPVLGHNIAFDLKFLLKSWIDLRKNISLDTFTIANFISFDEKSLSLEFLSNAYNLKLEGAHRALNDTIATVKLFEKLISLVQELSKTKKEILKYIISRSHDKWLVFILDNYLDKNIALIDSWVFTKYLLNNFPENKKSKWIILDKDMKIKSLKKLLSKLDNIEIRENQEKMLDIVDISFSENKMSLIEAPTWLWKTFAYLIPSIIYSVQNWEQIFISTTTKALQDQIYYKDLEFLKNNLDFEFTYTKLKWKRNYFWLHSFIMFMSEIDYFSEKEASFILKIIFWSFETKSFELDDLDYYGEEFSFLREISADDKIIFSKKNIYEKREPAVIARKLARNSNIVVINNSILFQDISSENAILWNIKNLVLDEAHNLEDIVTNSLRKTFSMSDLENTINSITMTSKKFKFKIEKLSENSEKLLLDMQVIFNSLELYLDFKTDSNTTYKNTLIKEDFYKNNIDSFDFKNLSMSIRNTFNIIIDSLKICPDDLYLEINKEINILENIIDIVDKILNKESEKEYIRTVRFTSFKWLLIEYTLLNVWSFLKKELWDKLDTCILTSATLSIDNDFSYITKMLDLGDFEFSKLESDFNYKKQALLYIPNDIWSIKNNIESIKTFLREFIYIVEWKTLVLFTALYLIKQIYLAINIDLRKKNINLYAQWIWWWKNKLLDFYKKNSENSVLFWTDTFWEGIDIPWDDLKYLIIHKIPFMVPNDPIFQARSVLFDDSFKQYSIPKSVIKLKQWFWRLIRTKMDSWIIVFLDNRIYSTSWGAILLNAFPWDINIKIGASHSLLNILNNKILKK